MSIEESGDTTKTIDEKVEESIHRVTHYRKHFPRKCSHFLTKKIKMQHFMLENVKIILEEDKKRSEDKMSVDKVEVPFIPDIDAKLTKKIADLQEEASNLIKILDQIKSEENSHVHQMTDI
ncbi:hypothetical protein J437_LFUL004863 [Ladona fulva]|uniref:Uncharacterized protein n=1 Tax=Ladona fulva TaxID=123851 RepID=A0A8K0JUC4_LADFU|nr:hypothetical protein J437_LFUL004863 [Ladona fulva]